MPGEIYTRLAEVAADQYGFVTTDDARDLGVNPMNLVRMSERGQIERRGTGLYRFHLIPADRLDAYMEATLWPRGARGVLSHETALELYEMSDVHPAKIHLTIPRDHRIRRRVPSAYRIHNEQLHADQVSRYEGIPIVTPAQAVLQSYAGGLGPALLEQAIDDGERNGHLTARQATQLRHELGVRTAGGVRR